MSGYSQGRDVEYAVVHHLAENGYDTVRAASCGRAASLRYYHAAGKARR